MNRSILASLAVTVVFSAAAAQADPIFGNPIQTKSLRLQERLPRAIIDPLAPGVVPEIATVPQGAFGPSRTVFGNQPNSDNRVLKSFEVLSDYDVRLLGRGLVPPDTMGAVGDTQYVQLINGGFGVFNKKNGKLIGATSDVGFWNQLGQTGTGGDPRILYDKQRDRWIAIGFGADTKNINIAVSDTADALGSWKATRFEGLARLPGINTPVPPATVGTRLQTLADYPTLAVDNNAIYIGTNNFRQEVKDGVTGYRGTSLFVLPVADIFAATGPSAANLKEFNTPFVSGSPTNDTTRGYAIQGVNSNEALDGKGMVVAASAFINGALSYDVFDAGTAGATLGTTSLIDSGYNSNLPARQPGLTGNPLLRNIDPSDDRVGSNAWELNGKTYLVHTVTPAGTDETRVRLLVIDSETKAVIQSLDIGQAGYDTYSGSLAVSDPGAKGDGRAVISYNRSGYDAASGKISIFANTYRIASDGTLVQTKSPILVKESLSAGYINGAVEATGVPAGRQRWGDYSAVTVDPNDPFTFWLIGEFARDAYTDFRAPYPNPPSGFARWGQFVAAITTPEPGTFATLFAGLAALGLRARRRRG